MAKNANDKRRKQKKARQCSEAAHDRTAVNAAANPDTIHAFEAWLDDAGVVWRECCRLGEAASGGQGVFAVRDIAAGEIVLAVPDDAVLMPDDSCIAKELQEAQLGNSGRGGARGEALALVLALMAEHYAGEGSRHAAYIRSLPQTLPGMPICWDAEQLALLDGTAVADKLHGIGVAQAALPDWGPSIELPSQVDMAWAQVVQPFVSEHSQHFGSAESDRRRCFEWATAVAAAYSFELGDDRFQAMVPLWDALNHVTGRCNVRLHHDEEDECLQIIATEPIAAGGELINNYGELGNAELLRRFGFVERGNAHDCAQVPWTALYDAAVPVTMDSQAAEVVQQAQLPSEKELKRRWRRLQYQRAVPESGYFSIARNGRPQAQAALAISLALTDLRSRVGTQSHGAPKVADQPAPAADITDASTSAAQPAADDASAGGRKAKRRRNAQQRAANVQASAAVPTSAADVLRVFRGLVARLSRYPDIGTDGWAANAAHDVDAEQLQDPGSSTWRGTAAVLVRQGEVDCWRAFANDWLVSTDVEQQVVNMLSSK